MRVLLIGLGLAVALAVALAIPPARADFDAGLAAYDGGRYREAAAHWAPLAKSGHAGAQVALAGLYRQGLGVTADAVRAARLYRQAAEQGLAIAQVNIGEMYLRGEGVPRDSATAYIWYRRAAAAGNTWAVKQAAALAKRLSAAERRRAEARLGAR